MSDRFEAFKNNLANAEREFADRNRLAGAKAQETLDGAREDFKNRMTYVGKLAVRLDQRYKDKLAAEKAEAKDPVPEGRDFGFESWPGEPPTRSGSDAPASRATDTVPQFAPSAFAQAPPATPVSRAMPTAPTAGVDGPVRQEGNLDDEDFAANGWLRG